NSAACLFGNFASLDRQFTTVEIDFEFMYVHLFSAGLRSRDILLCRNRRNICYFDEGELTGGKRAAAHIIHEPQPAVRSPEWTTKASVNTTASSNDPDSTSGVLKALPEHSCNA